MQFEHPIYIKDIDVLDQTQQGATEIVRGLECMMNEERLRELGLNSPKKISGREVLLLSSATK